MTKVKTFSELNDLMNYYSKHRGSTGIDNDLVNIQEAFVQVIANCNLSKSQIEDLKPFIIANNATLGMEPRKNNLTEVFNNTFNTSLSLEEQRTL